ncbi:MAG TPA: metallophosphoesterase [Polyangiaceae bacterium]
MSRAASFTVFFSIASAIVGLVHYYIWARLVRDLALPPSTHRALTVAVVVLGISIPMVFIWMVAMRASVPKPILLMAYIWMGMMLLVLFLLLAADVARIAYTLVQRFLLNAPPQSPERRVATARLLGAGVALLASGMGIRALRNGTAQVGVRRVRVPLDRLPPPLSGFRIVQLTDMHVGATLGREFVEEIVRQTNALKPDLVAITGDLVDGTVEQLRDRVAALKHLRAREGVFFVTGNHEYYSGVEEWCAELFRLGVRVLRDEHVTIGTSEASFDLAGVDDYSVRRADGGHGGNLAQALKGRNPERELVLLAHQPRHVHQASEFDVGLQLSGHTHGGQIWPWNYLVGLTQPVVSGLAKFGRTVVYVSNGTGYWGPPMRLRAPSEITEIVLTSSGTRESNA